MSAPAQRQSMFGRGGELHGPAYEWPVWSTTVRMLTSDPRALTSARRLVDTELAHVELAVSRSRRDSELATLPSGRRVRISVTLTEILAAALWAARETTGAADPTVGGRAEAIELDQQAQTVLLPRGVELDLGTVSRAWAADRCAAVVAEVLDIGVLVSLGGDIATAGPPGSSGDGSWEILVHDQEDDPSALIAIPTGLAVATSSTLTREWDVTSREMQHQLRSGRAARRPWRSATVVAQDCVTASTWSTAALVVGGTATALLEAQGYPARLVASDGSVRHLSGWPTDAEGAAVGA